MPPLALPEPQGSPPLEALAEVPSIALFVARARAVAPGFRLTNDSAATIAQICQHLDGIPLAIELAAARIKLLTPQAILARLSHRLSLLTGGPRDLPARQQTLRGAIEWSHDLLKPEEQTVFRRLGVFVAGWTVEAAEAVCDVEVLDGLSALIDHNLLRRSAESADGEPRFAMLEMIREYALERLVASGEESVVRQRHAQYFLELAERVEQKLHGEAQALWLNRLDIELDNVRLALIGCRDTNDGETFLWLGGALWEFWLQRGHVSEGRGWLEEALKRDGPPEARAKVLCGAGALARFLGEFDHARARLEQSVALRRQLGDRRGLAEALTYQGAVDKPRGHYAEARQSLEEAVGLWRELNERWGLAMALFDLGELTSVEGDYAQAQTLQEESLLLFRAVDDQERTAQTLNGLGEIARCQNDDKRV